MQKLKQNLICCILLLAIAFAMIEARPSTAENENIQELNNIENDAEDLRGNYYDLPSANLYSNVPLHRLQYLLGQYRPSSYYSSPTWNSGLNELFRMPETKRQVRYRQCYFNPISCFKK